MKERRKHKRTLLKSKLMLKRLNGEAADMVDISVENLSKTGMYFTCSEVLTIGAIYEAELTIWTKEVLHTILEIIRIEKKDEQLFYGASFVGMSEMVASRIETYQTVEDTLEKS